MCFCDDKYFKVINTKTGKEKLYKRVASISKRFFDGSFPDLVYSYIECRRMLHRDGDFYRIAVNKHPECEEVRRDIIRKYGVRLGKISDNLRHLLPMNRQ